MLQGEESREYLASLEVECAKQRSLLTPRRHLVSVPPGPHLLADMIAQSAILFDPERAPTGGEGGMDQDGIDPNMDPELAMVSSGSSSSRSVDD